jgi:hypothetical protein
MNRHQFRWDAFVFGLFFLAVLGQWAVWKMDWLETDDLAYVAAAVLILLGLVGIVGTAISARADRTAPFTPAASTEPEPTDDETAQDDPTENEPTDDQTTTREGNPA